MHACMHAFNAMYLTNLYNYDTSRSTVTVDFVQVIDHLRATGSVPGKRPLLGKRPCMYKI